MVRSITERIKQHPIVAFYILAFIVSWVGYLPQVAYTYGFFPFQSILFFVIGGIGPTIAAIIVTFVLHGKNGIGHLFRPLKQWRAGIFWYVVALFGYTIVWFSVIALPDGISLNVGKIDHWFILFPIFLMNIFMNVWEEVGWRGFALPRLQSHYNALVSSLVVGLMWGFWHLPLLLMKGYPMSNYPLGPFFVEIVASSVLYTWIYNNTKGSLLFATVFHAAGNTTGYFLEKGISNIQNFIFYESIILFIIAILIVFIFGQKNLSRSFEKVVDT